MQRIDIAISEEQAQRSYPIFIGQGLLARAEQLLPLSDYASACIISDENVAEYWLEPLRAAISKALPCAAIVVPPGEAFKSLQQVEQIWSQLREAGCDRRTLVLDLGGGVVGDMGGFAASTYMRGVDFVQLPTSLLSMVDASVGGKLGVNAHGIKNLVGVFRQPRAVIIDVDALSTLPERERLAGMGEVLKHGLIRDRAYFLRLADQAPERFGAEDWRSIIQQSCEIKAEVVEADVREGGLRKILNFGHTVGHAIESLLLETEDALLHGEAVGLGMLYEADLSRRMGFLEDRDVDQIEAALARYRLPTRLPRPLPLDAMMAKIQGDKKNVGGEIRWTLLHAIGRATFDLRVPEDRVIAALQR